MPENLTIATRLGPLSVVRHGSSAPPLVLWHSLFVDGRSWDPVLPALTARRSVIVIDGPGHGASPGPDRPYTIDDCADAALEVLDHLGLDAVDWIGNAWGGHVGVSLAARHPERVRTLAVLSSPMDALRGFARARSVVLVALFRVIGWRRWLLDVLVDALVHPAVQKAHPEVARYVRDAVTAPDPARMLLAMRSVMLGRRSCQHLLPRIAAPMLLVTTDDDLMWTPEVARADAARAKDAKVEVIAGARHLPPIEAPDRVSRLLDAWLDASSRRASRSSAQGNPVDSGA